MRRQQKEVLKQIPGAVVYATSTSFLIAKNLPMPRAPGSPNQSFSTLLGKSAIRGGAEQGRDCRQGNDYATSPQDGNLT